MTNAELIKALRYCISDEYVEKGCLICPICAPRQGEMKCNSHDDAIKYAADALEAAEKRIAELMQKDGEWIDEQRGRWIYAKCNLCGKVQDVRSNYCPNCGAKMNRKENADADN